MNRPSRGADAPTRRQRHKRRPVTESASLTHPMELPHHRLPYLLGLMALLLLQPDPAVFQLAEDPPEEAAVHPAGYAAAGAGREREGLGIFQVVGHLVEERIEQLFQRPL